MAFPCMLWVIAATHFSRCHLPTAYQLTVPHIPTLPLKATTFLRWFSLGFVTPDSVLLTSSVVFCLHSSSVAFVVVTPLRQTEHYSPISLLFHSSPSPATGGPGDSNNTGNFLAFLGARPGRPEAPGFLDARLATIGNGRSVRTASGATRWLQTSQDAWLVCGKL